MPFSIQLPFTRAAEFNRINHGTFRGWVRHSLALLQWLFGGLDDCVNPDLSKVERLVFVCLGNINRSAFAEAVARREGAATASLGLSTAPGLPAFSKAMETATGFAIDLRAHRTANLAEHQHREGDLMLAMEVRHVMRLRAAGVPAASIALLGAWSRPKRLHIHDPHTLSDDYFKACFTVIESATRNLVVDWRKHRSPKAGS